MNFHFVPLVAVWSVFALAVLVLLVRRKMIASHEDDQVHIMSNSNPEQVVVATKLEIIDKWGKILTVITAIFGLVIAALYVYSTFVGKGSLGE